MASTIAAITTGIGGIVTTADATGNLSLLSGTSTVVAVTSAGAAVTGTMSVSGATTLTGGLNTPLAVTSGGTGVATSTGSGANVLGTSPTLTTPTISSLSSAAATALTLQSAGTTAVTIDTSQNVGIGTSSPGAKLDVNGTIVVGHITSKAVGGEGGQITLNNTTDTAGVYHLDVDGSNHGRLFTTTNNTNLSLGQLAGTGGVVSLYTAGTERMRIDSSGNVGIGTATPGEKLDVVGNIRLSGADTYLKFINAGGYDFTIRGNNGGSLDFISPEYSATPIASMTNAGVFQFNSGYGSSANAYGCRAWVNFNGTGTVAIRASGNVSSITDNGTGDYTVNFTTAMPDVNYCVNGSCKELDSVAATSVVFLIGSGVTMANTYATGSIRTATQSSVTKYDSVDVNVAIFR